MEDVIAIRRRQVSDDKLRVGATFVPDEGVYVRLWAPNSTSADIEWIGQGRFLLARDEDGYHTGHFPDRKPGDRYIFHRDNDSHPDPASRYQPDGIKGPSEVVSLDFDWQDKDWRGIPFETWVIYEIHTGTYSDKHNFQGIIDDLPRLAALGVTTLEIMPVAQFAGDRNWGYDGVFPHAVQNSYGGPKALKALVDACHRHGLSIILDVVYNHLGPEGNVAYPCGPYTQSTYKTAWGDAINYDTEESEHVRRYFLQTVWQWLTEFHFDGLRLDAIQMIYDSSPLTFLEEVSRLRDEAEKIAGRKLVLIGETDKNDPRVVTPADQCGLGFDAHWADDFHHAVHATLTGEKDGYYQVYGGAAQLARIYERGVAFEGEYSAFHKRRHGRPYDGVDKRRLVATIQNHDQIGNRLFGERLTTLVEPDRARMAAFCLLLSPFMPLLFMGQEFGSKTPFLYFTSFLDDKLSEAVRKGRAEEWKSFGWKDNPPDPGAVDTFETSVLSQKAFEDGSEEADNEALYKALIGWSKKLRALPLSVDYDSARELITLRFGDQYAVLLCFHEQRQSWRAEQGWRPILSSSSDLNWPDRAADEVKLPGFSAALIERSAG